MVTYVIFNKDTPGARAAEDMAERLKREQLEVEMLDADSPRGIQLVENYDIMGRPAVALIRDDGSPVQIWQGEDGMPAPSEVEYLAHG
jgi:hypothetical protein